MNTTSNCDEATSNIILVATTNSFCLIAYYVTLFISQSGIRETIEKIANMKHFFRFSS